MKTAGGIFTNAQVVGDVRLPGGRLARVRTFLVHGRPRVDLRLFVLAEEPEGAPIPTRKGVTLPVDKLDDLMAVLAQVPEPRSGEPK